MPIVVNTPGYKERVAEAGTPGYRQRYGEMTAQAVQGTARAITDAGSAAMDEVGRIHEQIDVAAIEEAQAALAARRQQLLSDPEAGFTTSRKGKNAGEHHKAYLRDYDASVAALRAKLNKRQQARFAAVATNDRQSYVASLDHHVSREMELHQEQAHAAALDAHQSDVLAAAQRGEMENVAATIQSAMGAIDLRAAAKGWDAETTQRERLQFATQAHVGVLETMVQNGQGPQARLYLSMLKQEGVESGAPDDPQAGDTVDRVMLKKSGIEKLVNAAEADDAARRWEEKAYAATGDDPFLALQWLRKQNITDTKVFDGALARIEKRSDQDSETLRQADRQRLGRIEQELLTNKRGKFTRGADWEMLSDEGKGNALRMEQAIQDARGARGAKKQSDLLERERLARNVFKGLDLMGTDGYDKVSIDIDSHPEFQNIRPSVRQELINWQKKAQEQSTAVDFNGYKRQLEARLGEYGNGTQEKIREELNPYYDAYLDDPKNKGVAPTREQIDAWLTEVFTDPGWFKAPPVEDAVYEGTPLQPISGRPPAKAVGKVRVRKADGSTGTVPAAKLEAFMAANPGASVLP